MLEQRYSLHDKNYTVPTDINLAVRHSILAVIDLCDVLERETNCLKNSQTGLFLDIQLQKEAVAKRYELLVSDLINRGDSVKNADPVLKDSLDKIQKEFALISSENLQWMNKTKKATKRLKANIMSHTRNAYEKQTQFAYGASGKMQKTNITLNDLDERV